MSQSNKGTLKREFFIALMPPEDIKEPFKNLKSAEQAVHGDWQWNDLGGLHVSIAFPGPLTNDDLNGLKAALGKVKSAPVELSFDGLGHFLRGAIKHVVWARLHKDSDNSFRRLQNDIQESLNKHHIKRDVIDGTPHMTIIKAPSDDIDLVEAFTNAHNNIKTKSWHCDSFGLYERHLPPVVDGNQQGGVPPSYQLIETYPLA